MVDWRTMGLLLTPLIVLIVLGVVPVAVKAFVVDGHSVEHVLERFAAWSCDDEPYTCTG